MRRRSRGAAAAQRCGGCGGRDRLYQGLGDVLGLARLGWVEVWLPQAGHWLRKLEGIAATGCFDLLGLLGLVSAGRQCAAVGGPSRDGESDAWLAGGGPPSSMAFHLSSEGLECRNLLPLAAGWARGFEKISSEGGG